MHNYDFDRMTWPRCYKAELTLRVGHSNLWVWSNLLNSQNWRAVLGWWQKGKSERLDWKGHCWPGRWRGEEKECRQPYRIWEGPCRMPARPWGPSGDSHKQLDSTSNQNEPGREFFPSASHTLILALWCPEHKKPALLNLGQPLKQQ